MNNTKLILILWLAEIVIYVLFDTRKDKTNWLPVISIYLTSIFFTFRWGGIKWIIVPFLIMPVVGGAFAGIRDGVVMKKRDKAREKSIE